MRYIRTKYGEIFDTEVNGVWETNDGTIGIPTINGIVVTPKSFIVKEADTIEELCDEFVCENSLIDSSPRKENGRIIDRYSKLDNAIMLAKRGLIVYGAIWTDKGLIYVAKMNEKGELELL